MERINYGRTDCELSGAISKTFGFVLSEIFPTFRFAHEDVLKCRLEKRACSFDISKLFVWEERSKEVSRMSYFQTMTTYIRRVLVPFFLSIC